MSDGTWDSQRRWCIHGIREGLDRHDCGDCQILAREQGYDTSGGQTYIFTKRPDAPKQTPPE